jgi:predicted MFS family arabinose efflux permease
MAAWSLLGRLSFAMMNLSLLIYVQAETGSYAVAGMISAASLVGSATGTIAQSRLIDRHGPSRTLLIFAGPYALLGAGVIVLISAGLPTLPLAGLVVAQFAALPTVQVASRTMWPHLTPAGPMRDAAYSYEAVSFEVCWLLGPAVAALLATTLWPGSALLVASAVSTMAAVGFALTAAARSHPVRVSSESSERHGGSAADQGTGGAFRPAGLAVLLIAASAFGLTIGFVVVGVIAGTQANGTPQLAGVLLGLWSISSIVGGLAYQRRPWPRRVPLRLPALMAVFGGLLLMAALVDGMLALTATMVLAGATLVPQITIHNTLLDPLVPGRRLSEAFGWITTAIAVANAGGQALGGFVVQRYDYQAGFLAGAVCAIPLAVLVWAGRRQLVGQPLRSEAVGAAQ